MSDRSNSGRLWLVDDFIQYDSAAYGSWRLPVGAVKIVGEFTNDNGPFLDDWFLIFVTAEQGWYEASMSAEGTKEFLHELAMRLGADNLLVELAGATDYDSRILWPAALRGEPLFDITSVAIPWWRKLLRFGAGELSIRLSRSAKEHAGQVDVSASAGAG